MALTKEQFELISKALEDIIGADKPILVSFDAEMDIHVIVISGQTDLPVNIIMSHAMMILSFQHATNTMNHYKEWLLRQAQTNGQVLPTPKGTM